FGFAVAVLLLESGIAPSPLPLSPPGRGVGVRGRGVIAVALAAPALLVFLAGVGHRQDPVYLEFLELFVTRLGCDPLFLTVLASAAFYAYALARRVPWAVEALTGALAALALVRPDSLDLGDLGPAMPAPLLLAAALVLALGFWRRDAVRALVGAEGLAIVLALPLLEEIADPALRGVMTFHLALVVLFLVGAAFRDNVGEALRFGAALLTLL